MGSIVGRALFCFQGVMLRPKEVDEQSKGWRRGGARARKRASTAVRCRSAGRVQTRVTESEGGETS